LPDFDSYPGFQYNKTNIVDNEIDGDGLNAYGEDEDDHDIVIINVIASKDTLNNQPNLGNVLVDVPCGNEAGLMQTSQSYVCEGDSVIMGVAFNITDSVSVVGYVLHEGEEFDPVTSTVIEYSLTGEFRSLGNGGFPDFNDYCTVWTPYGAYVIFLDKVNVMKTKAGCEEDGYYVSVIVNGGVGVMHPMAAYLVMRDGTKRYTDISANEEVTFGPYSGSGNYMIEVLDAKGCTGTATGNYNCR